MSLFQESGQTPERRAQEAGQLVEKLADTIDNMNEHEAKFVKGLAERFEVYGEKTLVSSKQLFWLRDLLEKYL